MAHITVAAQGGHRYRVTVEEATGSTTHQVTATPAQLAHYAGPEASPEKLLQASFEFLLAREPKESILRQFDLPVIERYFPEFPRHIRDQF